jgi:hypothetical protein
VRLDRAARSIEISDEVKGGGHDVRLAFHLGPDVRAELAGSVATLAWTTDSGQGTARLALPGELSWKLHRAETGPILGWYSAGLGSRVPAGTLLGTGRSSPDNPLITFLEFFSNGNIAGQCAPCPDVSLGKADAAQKGAHGSQAEAR